jgi:hypothetical protein
MSLAVTWLSLIPFSNRAGDRRFSMLMRGSKRAAVSVLFGNPRRRLSALDAAIPKPPPEPVTVVVQQEDYGSADWGSRNFDPVKWAKKPRSWW